jgi:hypothetical protein
VNLSLLLTDCSPPSKNLKIRIHKIVLYGCKMSVALIEDID